MQAIENQFHTRGNAQLVKDTKQIVPHDGSDALAVGFACILAFGFGYASSALLKASLAPALAWSLCGASASFLAYNFPPNARAFMGDSGSNFIGFALGFLAIECFAARSPGDSRAVLLPFVAAAIPLVDLFAAVARRVRAKRSPAFGDRRHLYDRLLARGWSPRRVAGAYYAAAVVSVLVALCVLRAPRNAGVAVSVAFALGIGLLCVSLGCLETGDGRAETPGAVRYEGSSAPANAARQNAVQGEIPSAGD